MPPRKGLSSPVGGPLALREDQQGIALGEQGPDVAQGLAGAGLALGQREGVEEQRRQVVVEAVGRPRLAAVLLGEEVGLEELLGHGDGHPVAPAGRQRPQDHRAVQVALVVRGEDDRAGQALEVLEPFHLHPGEDAADRQDPGRQAGVPHPRERPAPVPGGEGDRALLRRSLRRASRGEPAPREPVASTAVPALPASPAAPSPASVARSATVRASANADSSIVVWACSSIAISSSTRSSELRPSASIVVSGPMSVRPGAKRCTAARTVSARRSADAGGRRRRVAVDPALHLAPFQLARAVGARQLGARPHRRAADLLVIAERLVGALHDGVEIDAGIRRIGDDHRVDALLAVPGPADHRRVPHAGDRGERALDVLGEDVQPLGRDDHLLLAALDVDAALLVDAADVAGVQPAVREGLARWPRARRSSPW